MTSARVAAAHPDGSDYSHRYPTAGPGIHVAIAQLMRSILQQVADDPSTIWANLTSVAASRLPAVCHAGITIVHRRTIVRSLAPSDDHAAMLDRIQQRHLQGPAVEAAWDHRTRWVTDLSGEHRWPEFTSQAMTDTPIRSILTFPLFFEHATSGVLNLYGDQPDPFGVEGEQIALTFATHAAAAVEASRREKRFRKRLSETDLAAQARGILMERYKISSGQAVSLLEQLAKQRQKSVPETARRLISAKVWSGDRLAR